MRCALTVCRHCQQFAVERKWGRQAGRADRREVRISKRYAICDSRCGYNSNARPTACVFLGLPGRFVNCFQLHVAAHFGSASLASSPPALFGSSLPPLAFLGVIIVQRKRKFLSHSSLIHSAFLLILFLLLSCCAFSLTALHFSSLSVAFNHFLYLPHSLSLLLLHN